MKILLIDDDPLNILIMQETLHGEGYETLEAFDGQAGLDMLRKHKDDIQLVLLDWMMPNLTGIEFMEHVKQDGSLKRIPIIMQTARSMSRDVITGSQTGVFYFLTKPFDPSMLLSIVRSALEK